MLKSDFIYYHLFINVFLIIILTLNNVISEDSMYDTNQQNEEHGKHATLFDFTKVNNVDEWQEESDTVREVGMSKATFTLQKTRLFQRAILFTLLNPQPNGACFAGVKIETMFDLSDYESLTLNIRGQGDNSGYKVVLKHRSHNATSPTYEQMFEAPMGEFYTVRLPLDKFLPYSRGKLLNDTAPLDKSHITSIGFQMYGGVYLPEKQHGVSSLEIDWLRADI